MWGFFGEYCAFKTQGREVNSPKIIIIMTWTEFGVSQGICFSFCRL